MELTADEMELTAELNSRHAVLLEYGNRRNVVLWFRDDEDYRRRPMITVQGRGHFRDGLMNRRHPNGTRLARWWLGLPPEKRRTYAYAVWDPSAPQERPAEPGSQVRVLNLWPALDDELDFTVPPMPGEVIGWRCRIGAPLTSRRLLS